MHEGGQEERIEGVKGTKVVRVVNHIVDVFMGVKFCITTFFSSDGYHIRADRKSAWIHSAFFQKKKTSKLNVLLCTPKIESKK